MKGHLHERVFQRGARASEAALQTGALARPLFDQLSQSLRLRKQDRAILSGAHRTRGGVCLCGRSILDHFSDTNDFLDCARVAQERE